MSASDIAIRLAELQGWTEIFFSKLLNQWRGTPLDVSPVAFPAIAIPRPDTDAGDAWRLMCWLLARDYDVRITWCCVVLRFPASSSETERKWRADHDNTEQGVMAALCDAAIAALTESEADK